jgi:tRNA(fMet)-specific endonuclease VapC
LHFIKISDILIPSYIGIDAYSQRNHPDYKNYPFETPRNMGKNDLWIAATASILNLKLITTDQDFNHLDATFLSLQNVLQSEIKMFF